MAWKLLGSKKWFVLLAVVAVGIYLGFFHTAKPMRQSVPEASIKQLPTKSAANNGDKNINTPTGNNQGTGTDNHGRASLPISTSPNQWIQSASGDITVKQPVSNQTISSGVELDGTSKVDKVQFRLIDDTYGVISQGFISVVENSFSAKINFDHHGSSGRLDVFSVNGDGVEINEVQIPVKFN
jgi:hypothetical protein